MDSPTTTEELLKAISNLTINKSSGLDDSPVEMCFKNQECNS